MHDDRLHGLLDTDRRRLVRAATRLLGPAEAEDAVQDACVRALEAGGAVPEVPQAWLLTVVRHLAVDRLRRRQWMQRWLADMAVGEAERAWPSAESDAAMAQQAAHALRLLAAHVTPAEGAALLLHEVFEVAHADIAQASGRSEAASRQQLRRALQRLRQAGAGPRAPAPAEHEAREEAAWRIYLQALQQRDPQALWALLGQPPISASACAGPLRQAASPSAPATTTSGVVQVGGQLALVLTLDGVTLCVLPLGLQPSRDPAPALA